MTHALVTNISLADISELMRLFSIVNHVLVEHHNGARLGSSMHFRNEKRHILLAERSDPEAPEDDACRYDFFASEKTMRICDHPEHVLSWQSKNNELKQFQGGVWFKRVGLIGAISGFTGEEDESGILWIGSRMNWESPQDTYAMSLISGNTRYSALYQEFTEAERLAA